MASLPQNSNTRTSSKTIASAVRYQQVHPKKQLFIYGTTLANYPGQSKIELHFICKPDDAGSPSSILQVQTRISMQVANRDELKALSLREAILLLLTTLAGSCER